MLQRIRTYLDLCGYAFNRARECVRAERFRESEVWFSRGCISLDKAEFLLCALENMERREC